MNVRISTLVQNLLAKREPTGQSHVVQLGRAVGGWRFDWVWNAHEALLRDQSIFARASWLPPLSFGTVRVPVLMTCCCQQFIHHFPNHTLSYLDPILFPVFKFYSRLAGWGLRTLIQTSIRCSHREQTHKHTPGMRLGKILHPPVSCIREILLMLWRKVFPLTKGFKIGWGHDELQRKLFCIRVEARGLPLLGLNCDK